MRPERGCMTDWAIQISDFYRTQFLRMAKAHFGGAMNLHGNHVFMGFQFEEIFKPGKWGRETEQITARIYYFSNSSFTLLCFLKKVGQ